MIVVGGFMITMGFIAGMTSGEPPSPDVWLIIGFIALMAGIAERKK